MMNNKGTALIITMTYILIVSMLCAAAFAFGMQHYKMISRRVDREMKLQANEGVLYYGLFSGAASGTKYTVGQTSNVEYNVSGGKLSAKVTYEEF